MSAETEQVIDQEEDHQWEQRVAKLRDLLISGIKGEEYRKTMKEYKDLIFSGWENIK